MRSGKITNDDIRGLAKVKLDEVDKAREVRSGGLGHVQKRNEVYFGRSMLWKEVRGRRRGLSLWYERTCRWQSPRKIQKTPQMETGDHLWDSEEFPPLVYVFQAMAKGAGQEDKTTSFLWEAYHLPEQIPFSELSFFHPDLPISYAHNVQKSRATRLPK